MKTFIVQLPDGQAVNQSTVIKGKNNPAYKIKTESEICEFLFRAFCMENKCKSLTDWANQLNETGEYNGQMTKYDALDNMASNYTLNIDGKHVSIYEFYQQHKPFKK
jgi:hypothetical protein